MTDLPVVHAGHGGIVADGVAALAQPGSLIVALRIVTARLEDMRSARDELGALYDTTPDDLPPWAVGVLDVMVTIEGVIR